MEDRVYTEQELSEMADALLKEDQARNEVARPKPEVPEDIGEEENSRPSDSVSDKGASKSWEAARALRVREQLERAPDLLSCRERKVLELRYGLADGRTRTWEEVGKIFNLAPDRIRQIESQALWQLRHYRPLCRSKKLRDFMNETTAQPEGAPPLSVDD